MNEVRQLFPDVLKSLLCLPTEGYCTAKKKFGGFLQGFKNIIIIIIMVKNASVLCYPGAKWAVNYVWWKVQGVGEVHGLPQC